MRWVSRCAVALLAALLCARAAAFTVDCNQDYADCEKELSKLTDDDEQPPPSISTNSSKLQTTEISPPREFTPVTEPTELASTERGENVTSTPSLLTTFPPKPNATALAKGRLLNLSVDELQSFANALHNQTSEETKTQPRKHLGDLSDVSLDAEEDFDFPPHKVNGEDSRILHKGLSDSFYSNLQAPFSEPRMEVIGAEKSSFESESCAENGVQYKAGERVERGCDESCECGAHGAWRCTLRCQQPYVRRGRRLTDPLCHETPVDDCCSIIACASGHDADLKVSASGSQKGEPCRYGNNSYMLGQKWEVGCEQICSCGPKSIVTCKPRCASLKPSEHCISVQDPHDACCQVQVCDVTHDAHELDVPPPPSTPAATRPASATLRTTIQERVDSDFNELIDTTKAYNKELQPFLKVRPPLEPRPIVEPDPELDTLSSTDPAPKTKPRPLLEPRPPMDTLSPAGPRLLDDYHPLVVNQTKMETSSEHQRIVEPVTSLVVLKNNTVRINFARPNSSENPFHLQISMNKGMTFKDVTLTNGVNLQGLEQGLDYVLKVRETGKTFDFTIPITNASGYDVQSKNDDLPGNDTLGCMSEGVHYNVGEEFHIGCSELCECVGAGRRECAALECPSHVGLELVSPACVRWAPDPPDWTPRPPACCPSRMRCLSDGSCDYRGHKIPNWSEAPISLTGCDQRCFCESGTLDCQEVCSALPPLPPQTLRCQPGYRPAPVNISHDDCCKQWGCIPTASSNSSTHPKSTHSMPHSGEPFIKPINFVTPLPPPTTIPPTTTTSRPTVSTETDDLFLPTNPPLRHQLYKLEMKPMNIYSKFMKHPSPLIKMHSNINSDGVFKMNPKLHYSYNFTKSILPKSPHKFLGPLVDPYSDTYQQNFGDVELKSPSTNVEVTTLNHLSQDHSTQTDTRQSDRPTRYTTVKTKPLSDPAELLFPNMHRQRGPTLYNEDAIVGKKSGNQNRNVIRYFEPNINVTKYILPHSNPVLVSNSPIRNIDINRKFSYIPQTQQIKLGNHQISMGTPQTAENNMRVLHKAPNPYQSVLHRTTIPKSVPRYDSKYDLDSYPRQEPQPTFAPMVVEELLRQLEEAEHQTAPAPATRTDRARDRPTPDSRLTASHAPGATTAVSEKLQPAFMPTPSPPVHFPPSDYDDRDEDYDHINHIQRPLSPQPPPPRLPGLNLPLPAPPPSGPGAFDQADTSKLNLMSLVADSATSVKILFELPSVLVGLRGSVDLRYTDKDDEDFSQWYSQVFAPSDEVLTTARLEFRLTGLKPATTYRLRGKLYLHGLTLEPVSSVYSVRTLDSPPVMIEEKRRPVETALRIVQLNATNAQLTWRHFAEDEMQYIDGIQVRYRPLEQPIYSMTELLHHARTTAELHDLRPGARYEAALVLVPPPRSPIELYDTATLNFTTPEFYDMYNWSASLEAVAVGAGSVQVMWRGVPAPPERYVRVYRAAHACDPAPGSAGDDAHAHAHGHAQRERDTFKLADRDQPPQLLLTGLPPDTKCRVWLELFLTNGKVKISNVLDVTTKSESSNDIIDNEVQASVVGSRAAASAAAGGAHGDYYGALVVVGVVAALGALTSLLLLLVVVRRHRPHSVSITPVPSAPRAPSLPPYDNPAYKLELQQETMDL